jgi:hypothetical protein
MSLHFDYPGEMQRLPLDADTADRLLAGHVDPEDAPPGYSRVAALLAAEGAADADLDPRFVAVLAATVRSAPVPKARPSMRSIMPRIRLAAALTAIALVGTTGLAFAGSLPDAAQDIASDMLAKAGITVPGPNEHAGDHPSTRGPASDHPGATPTSNGKGSEISDIARSDLQGLDKGAAVSTAASNGKSRAGQEHSAPVATPNAGGTETADTASDGHSTDGTAKADEAATATARPARRTPLSDSRTALSDPFTGLHWPPRRGA